MGQKYLFESKLYYTDYTTVLQSKNKVYLKNAPYGASSFSCDPGGLFWNDGDGTHASVQDELVFFLGVFSVRIIRRGPLQPLCTSIGKENSSRPSYWSRGGCTATSTLHPLHY